MIIIHQLIYKLVNVIKMMVEKILLKKNQMVHLNNIKEFYLLHKIECYLKLVIIHFILNPLQEV